MGPRRHSGAEESTAYAGYVTDSVWRSRPLLAEARRAKVSYLLGGVELRISSRAARRLVSLSLACGFAATPAIA